MSDVKIIDSKLLLARDFSSLMEWSINKIPKITKDWTDFTITAPETIFLSTSCYIYDIMNFALDRKFLNNQVRYSRDIDSLINMCVLRGIEVPGYMASKTTLSATFDTSGLGDTSIELIKGCKFEVFDVLAQKTVVLNLDVDTDIISGSNILYLTEGTINSIDIELNDISPIGTYVLEEDMIALNTVEFYVDNSIWRKVNDAFLITDFVPSYSVHRYYFGHTLIKLMPGFLTEIGNDSINIKYNITSGNSGNVGTGSEINPQDRLIDTNGNNVTDRVTLSIVRSIGGADALDIEEVRRLIGGESSEVQTLVNLEDYEDVVNSVDAVVGCVVKDINNLKYIYFIPDIDYEDYGYTLEEIAQNINVAVYDKVPAFTKINVEPVLIRPMSLIVNVFLNRNELNITLLESRVEEYINNIFDRRNVNPGFELNRSAISVELETISSSIGHIVISYPISDVKCKWNEIMRLDNISINFGRG